MGVEILFPCSLYFADVGRGPEDVAGAEAEAYAKDVVMADFEEAGDDDVFRKIRTDFDAKGIAQSDHQVRRTMIDLMEQAIAQIKDAK